MADEQNAPTTLREEYAASFDALDNAPAPETPAPAATAPVETAEAKAERARDEAGRFAKEQDAVKPPVAKPAAPGAAPIPALLAPTPEAPIPRPPKPSSWKKEFDAQWETLDPKVAAYINTRESQYASGVSTYKAEAEQARALNEAIAPFVPNLQKYNIEPTEWIRNLGQAHQRLALGTPQEKVMTAVDLIRGFGIDPQALFSVLSGQVAYQPPPAAPQPSIDIDRVVEDKLSQREIKSEFNKFLSEVEVKYPHYEEVKESMAGLLQAGFAQDYASAYETALRLPQYQHLFEAQQQQQRAQSDADKVAAQKAQVTRARSNAVSVKTSTPSGPTNTPTENKSLREEIAANLDAVSSGRV